MADGNIVKYGDWSDEEFDKEKKEAEDREGSDSEFWKIPEGLSIHRMLPGLHGLNKPWVAIAQHFIDLPNGDKVQFNCPRLMANKPCPSCRKQQKLRATGNRNDFKIAGKFMARWRQLANTINRAKEELGPRILGFGKTIYDVLKDERDDGKNFAHPMTGYDIRLRRKGMKKDDTEYRVRLADEQSKISGSAAQFREWCEMASDLNRHMAILPEEEIIEMLTGGGGGDEKKGRGRRRDRDEESERDTGSDPGADRKVVDAAGETVEDRPAKQPPATKDDDDWGAVPTTGVTRPNPKSAKPDFDETDDDDSIPFG